MTDDAQPWSAMVAMIERLLDEHPRLPNGEDVEVSGDADAFRARMDACEATVEGARWWEPATDAHARALADGIADELVGCWNGERAWRGYLWAMSALDDPPAT
jgi:hypothetical protein